jgi:hypothetical protein
MQDYAAPCWFAAYVDTERGNPLATPSDLHPAPARRPVRVAPQQERDPVRCSSPGWHVLPNRSGSKPVQAQRLLTSAGGPVRANDVD